MALTVIGRSTVLLAQNAAQLWEGMLYAVLLGLALVAAAVVILLAGKYRRNVRDDSLTASDQLAQFRSLYEEGAITREEFTRLKGLLGSQLRQSLKVPARPAAEGGNPHERLPPNDNPGNVPPGAVDPRASDTGPP